MALSAFSVAGTRRPRLAFRRSYVHKAAITLAICIGMTAPPGTRAAVPDWCRPLPRPEYKTIERVAVSDPWFEVYKPAPGVYAIYEPHQSEEDISYLIVGAKQALLFDTGMGIANIRAVVRQ